ncbi:hypothetical protein KIH41_13385 [Litoribacter ruber]|uniref:hypothetical protein n=1 Tax=Litoribacter ruber TaxID=702568 RepID=UPI001BDA2ACB|nr:hypothetical protein [Litoribacter ruber]MBT0812273.1 hypothetical protein [Litoribacter ruber]
MKERVLVIINIGLVLIGIIYHDWLSNLMGSYWFYMGYGLMFAIMFTFRPNALKTKHELVQYVYPLSALVLFHVFSLSANEQVHIYHLVAGSLLGVILIKVEMWLLERVFCLFPRYGSNS